MIEFKMDDIFRSECEAITNTVNTKGVMGAGLALAFKRRYPEMYKEYVEVCKKNELRPGKMHVWENPTGNPKYIINFPTKDDFRKDSEMSYIIDGLVALKDEIINRNIRSIAVPALGSGLGGLQWEEVKSLIKNFELMLPEIVRVVVYEPLN
jgi:O-acetyl-ADP-ribose deacetylase (regulator of RNase III)